MIGQGHRGRKQETLDANLSGFKVLSLHHVRTVSWTTLGHGKPSEGATEQKTAQRTQSLCPVRFELGGQGCLGAAQALLSN